MGTKPGGGGPLSGQSRKMPKYLADLKCMYMVIFVRFWHYPGFSGGFYRTRHTDMEGLQASKLLSRAPYVCAWLCVPYSTNRVVIHTMALCTVPPGGRVRLVLPSTAWKFLQWAHRPG